MKKNHIRKFFALSLAALTLGGTLTGCGKPAGESSTDSTGAVQSPSESGDKVYKIGISQYAEHPSLDNCREGFIQGLAEAGFVEGENVEFVYQNAQSDNTVCMQIGQQLVSSKVDLVGAVATPAAQMAFTSTEAAGVPLVYVAVADPVAAGLAGADGTSGKPVTGVSDLIPAEKQLEMIRAFLPDAKKIGILYSTGEVNSEAQLKLYQDAAAQFGFEIVPSGVSSTADVALAAKALSAKVDCLSNLTDNTVVSVLPAVLDAANAAGIPVFGSEIEQVKSGCLASEGIEYVALGKRAGAMAAKVLQGEDISKIPYETVTDFSADVNMTTLANLGLTLPEAYSDATQHQ